MINRSGKRKKLKSSYNLYHIGRCDVQDWTNKFLHEIALECYHKIIQTLPYMALVKKKTKLKMSQHHAYLQNGIISMQDIGYCQQYGCSVLFIVKQGALKFEAVCLLCSSLKDATLIFDGISAGYKSANHPAFNNSDPWENTTDGDFIDDSLQDSSFYSNIRMYSSLIDIPGTSEPEYPSPHRNLCFSMEDIFNTDNAPLLNTTTIVQKSGKLRTDSAGRNCAAGTIELPTNVVKPNMRHADSKRFEDTSVINTTPTKTFAYKVSRNSLI